MFCFVRHFSPELILHPTLSAGTPLSRVHVYDRRQKLEIMLYEVLNMDIVLHKRISSLFMMNGCTSFYLLSLIQDAID